jgi:hypothetical protein
MFPGILVSFRPFLAPLRYGTGEGMPQLKIIIVGGGFGGWSIEPTIICFNRKKPVVAEVR